MLSPSSGNTVIKSKLIGRRMFLLTAAKVVVTVGIIGRLVSLQINESKKYNNININRIRLYKFLNKLLNFNLIFKFFLILSMKCQIPINKIKIEVK